MPDLVNVPRVAEPCIIIIVVEVPGRNVYLLPQFSSFTDGFRGDLGEDIDDKYFRIMFDALIKK